MKVTQHYILMISLVLLGCQPNAVPHVEQWSTYEITLESKKDYDNPYIDVEVWAVFTNEQGEELVRPAFWDGGKTWKVRFAPPDAESRWTWETAATNEQDKELHEVRGRLQSVPYSGDDPFRQHGPLQVSDGFRSVVHHDGTKFLIVGDTPWALPYRATSSQVLAYARDRQSKGFNTALLMTVQPDMNAEGPNARDTPQGFARGFGDLHQGHINQLVPEYFQYFDTLTSTLLDHGIVPVYQPIFHGFGWKGLQVLGGAIEPEEYVRYCKYLLARYGSRPAMWLIAADGGGQDPGILESGEMLEEWDAYRQPTGIHYNPCDDYVAKWAQHKDSLTRCMHYNKVHQEKVWLDFQWAQTGHDGLHLLHKVTKMYDNEPTKAVLNGEPTYEGMGGGQNGVGWWQGKEAWSQLTAGGTMGMVYGAAGLWQWKVAPDEEGWSNWADQPVSWKEALDLEGSTYVGLLGKVLEPYDLTDIKRRHDLVLEGDASLLAREGALYVAYVGTAEPVRIQGTDDLNYYWVNPKTGDRSELLAAGEDHVFQPPFTPSVLILEP